MSFCGSYGDKNMILHKIGLTGNVSQYMVFATRAGGYEMRDLKALLQQSDRENAERLQKIRSELKSLPPGRLEALQMKNRTYYYQRGQSKRRGITRNPELVRKLARKRYLMEERKIIQNNLAQIKKTLSVCESYSLDAILQRIPLRVRQLPRQYFYKKRVTHDYDKNTSHPEHLLYVTNGGEVVRSKSERSIGDMLEEYGLDYDYDRRVEGYFYYADFTIHCRDGSIIIWEHFGLIDTYEDYHKKALIRMEDYRKNGWRQWRNLICTFEEDIRDPQILREIIEFFILPRAI